MENMMKSYYKRKAHDRDDGWRVRDIDNVYTVVPYFLRTRIDSQCFFEEEIDIEKIEAFIKEHKQDIPDLSVMHVVIAAMVRIISQRPYINRYVVYNKLYAHNEIMIALVIKRSLTDRGVETPIKPIFEPTDTLEDVVRRVNEKLNENLSADAKNSSDSTASLLGKLPSWLLRMIVGVLRGLDNIGLLPKSIRDSSPWHTGAFITNVGSLGIGPIYHHLYEFGTCSFFVAMGKKERKEFTDANGNTFVHRFLGLKYVIDERICDGHYYAVSMRLMRRLMNNPELLLLPPQKVVMDDGVTHKVEPDNLIDKFNNRTNKLSKE